MNAKRKTIPDFFDDDPFDPVNTATGRLNREKTQSSGSSIKADQTGWDKKKAGFYLPKELIDRFNRQYHQLKLDGVPVGNKSALLEVILEFGLGEMGQGSKSEIMNKLLKG